MTSRKGYLLRPTNYTTKMACSDSPSANSFLVDSLISGRTEGSAHYYQSSGVYLPPSSDYSYGLSNCGYFPAPKRTENQNVLHTSGPFMQGMETWLETSRSCRTEQLSSQSVSRSFSPAIKEENSYCFYESGKCLKSTGTDDVPFSRVATSVCPAGSNSSVPVPGYFRLSQTCSSAKGYYPNDLADSGHFVRFEESHPSLSGETDGPENEEPAAQTDEESRRSPSGPSASPQAPESEAENAQKANEGLFWFLFGFFYLLLCCCFFTFKCMACIFRPNTVPTGVSQ